MKAYHLGIYMGHDTGVAIVDDALNIVRVFEEERFDGEKMTYFNPYFALKEVIRLNFKHFKTITFGFRPDEALVDFLKKFVRFQKVRCAEVLNYLSGKIKWDEVRFVGHHDCHAAGAFYPSGFETSAILVADGTGESESTSFYAGEGHTVSKISSEWTRDFSLGILYQYFTEWLGYRSANTSQHCGKIMGLSSYGSPVYKAEIRDLLKADGNTCRWPHGSLLRMREEMALLLSTPQPKPTHEYNAMQADVAASIQELLEEMVLEKLQQFKRRMPFKNLCFSGGVAMNSLLNYRILKSGVCDRLFVQPLASDRGIALGAALASAASFVPKGSPPSSRRMKSVYAGYGETADHGELTRIMAAYDLPITVAGEHVSPDHVARLLNENQIIALFRGREEIGPRALGNRSIMAAPCSVSRDRTNREVKYREPWRPFAPTILEEFLGDYFDVNRPEPFMSVIYGVLDEKIDEMDGVTHVDGTARLQTVTREQNPRFYDIIQAFQELTGTPVILNTSFNINGQPIVRTVYDGIMTFLSSGIDGLLIGDTLVRKSDTLPKERINRLDRILFEITKEASALVIQVLDYSHETEDLLSKIADASSVRFRKAFGARPLARCHVPAHTKMSWQVMSEMAPYVNRFVHGDNPVPELNKDEICVMVSGRRLIEASSRPTRTYVNFDRDVFRDLIEAYAQRPDREQIFLLDREYHLFDMAYLNSRFQKAWSDWEKDGFRPLKRDHDHRLKPIASAYGFPDSGWEEDVAHEDMVETLADA
ncbi:MAG: carbamoyltransferase C-terminal domain-containing protein [Deltaproteobacteria bacterium]|nr:carbamoyltransferase C-terminal domain-containing protein [Deltaproteobacteria bacterium]